MIKLSERGFTIVELLVAIGILAVVTPLLATGMFQILTSTERGRAGFEAQADTRTAAGWMSQDIVMAQTAEVVSPPSLPCGNATFLATFTWTDLYGDPTSPQPHSVSYCKSVSPPSPNDTELQRIYDGGAPIVIGRHIKSVVFDLGCTPNDGLSGPVVTIDIIADPERNRFSVMDTKAVQVKMMPMPASPGPAPCPP